MFAALKDTYAYHTFEKMPVVSIVFNEALRMPESSSGVTRTSLDRGRIGRSRFGKQYNRAPWYSWHAFRTMARGLTPAINGKKFFSLLKLCVNGLQETYDSYLYGSPTATCHFMISVAVGLWSHLTTSICLMMQHGNRRLAI